MLQLLGAALAALLAGINVVLALVNTARIAARVGIIISTGLWITYIGVLVLTALISGPLPFGLFFWAYLGLAAILLPVILLLVAAWWFGGWIADLVLVVLLRRWLAELWRHPIYIVRFIVGAIAVPAMVGFVVRMLFGFIPGFLWTALTAVPLLALGIWAVPEGWPRRAMQGASALILAAIVLPPVLAFLWGWTVYIALHVAAAASNVWLWATSIWTSGTPWILLGLGVSAAAAFLLRLFPGEKGGSHA